jgi:1-acyl-sn-glycerol-3-phosphate acyltransferase
VRALRGLINTVFMGLWTAFMVTLAITLGAIRRDPNLFKRMQRQWARGLTRFWGVELVVVGADHMPTGRSYVVMSNHLSWADIVVLFLALPVSPGFLAKKELMKVPFLAAALRAGGHVIIDRKKHSSARETLRSAAAQIKDGKTVLIFPEGTRGSSDSIGKFKKGGFYLAVDAGVPLLPVGIRGARSVFPREGLLVYPGRIEVHIGAALSPEEVAAASSDQLVELVRAEIMELSAMPDRDAARDEPAPA